MPILHAAIVQAEVLPDLASALEATADLARDAKAAGAELIVFPETWLPGYPAWLDVCRDAALWDHEPVKAVYRRLAENSVVVEGESGRALSRLAAAVGATIVIGVSERVDRGPGRGTLYNSLLTYNPAGEVINHHRKLVPTYTERMVWGQGDGTGLSAAASPGGRVGGLICWEHWMPLARQTLHQSGEDVHVAAWPMVKEMHLVASRHYAFEGRCYVLAAGSLLRASALPPELPDRIAGADTPESWVLRGGSCIIGPDGGFLAGPVLDQPAILHGELDLKRIREESMTLDVTGHYHRPDLFEFRTRGESRNRSE